MAVRFTGVLSRAPVTSLQQAGLKPGHMVYPLDPPHDGLVLRMPKWQPKREDLEPYLETLGLNGADWAFIAYETWSGPVDYFQRYGQIGEDRLESIAQYDQKAQRLYSELMERLGLGALAEGFAPLQKGFWG
ncbi:hypothetical protein [Pseudooceanicola onchidii]|uniref:hypothetical protein n=1 Tax=Pseudooceanicola onchidii TaxID=2562279 RepID=UPI0010AACF26|nr:hypothetical protein [Pseudooceanicola onchidii]